MTGRHTPLYQQIRERIRAEFLSEALGEAMTRLPTERELQAHYGVSRPTVSKALAALAAEGCIARSQGRGSFAVRQDGPPNGMGQRLIGYVAPLSDAPLVQRAFRGMDRAGHRKGYRVLLSSAGFSVDRERLAVEDLIAAGVRGLVIYPVPRVTSELQDDYLTRSDLPVPVVLIDTPAPEHAHARVVFDNRRAGYAMTAWLLSRGYRRIAMLSCGDELVHTPLIERRIGYRNALEDHGIRYDPELIKGIDVRITVPDASAALEAWFRLKEPPHAIIAPEDMIALDIIDILASSGIRVPEDVRVVGFDNREAARRHRPPLPTTNPDFERMGEIACDLLTEAIDGGAISNRTYVLDVPLLVRRSLEPPATPGIVLGKGIRAAAPTQTSA